MDSQHSNTWRSLRILNRTHDWTYVEYDPEFAFAEGTVLQHYELYDNGHDPYQLRNVYAETAPQVQAALHQQLADYFTCSGTECP